jgi:transketolase
MAMQRRQGPAALVLTRQKLPVLERERQHASALQAMRGGYVLVEAEVDGHRVAPHVILIGTGSEVHVCLEARARLADDGVAARVVSMPSLTRFLSQPSEYQNEVILPEVPARVAVEAGATLGWAEVVGPMGEVVGLDRFGASAPGEIVMRELGFTAENVAERAREVIARSNRPSALSTFSRV